MPLKLIYGPPNSGKRGRVLEAFAAAASRDPVLVVPNYDDVFDFQRELCGERGVVGGVVTTFGGLIAELARSAESPPPPPLSRVQRLRAVAVAIAESRERLAPLRRSAARPGFAASLSRLLEELQAAGIDPGRVAAGAATLDGSAYLADVATLFGAYEEVRARLGRGDSQTEARAALAALERMPAAWEGRPVLLYGLDDLTGSQLELLRRLVAHAEVTVALPFEEGREVMGARARLIERLRQLGAAEATTEPVAANTENPLLFHLERGFGVAGAPRAEPGEGLRLLRSAGARGEAEAVGAAVGRLLHDGAAAETIAIVVADPARRGPLLAEVLQSYGVPVALEAELPVAASGVGGALLALLQAEHGTGRAADVLRWLRGPAGVGQEAVDWLERSVRRQRARTAAEALDLWLERHGELPHDLAALREAEPGDYAAALAALTGRMATRFLATGADGPPPGPGDGTELRAAATVSKALAELSQLGAMAPGPGELLELLADLRFRLWSGPVEGRARIADPQRLRALRFDHVVVASLQDGEFPSRGGGDPFLSETLRESLGLDPRRDEDAEQRYRFYTSLSLARRSLALSYRECDEAGAAEARSPLIDDVRDLLAPPPPAAGADPVEAAIGGGRGLADVVFPATAAPSRDELARALAAAGAERRAPLLEQAAPPEPEREAIAARLERAARAEAASRAPGPLRNPAVLERLAAVPAYGGTTLERFEVCSYIWFAEHELAPQLLEPVPDPLLQGGIVHQALDALYRERPGGAPRPTAATLPAWQDRAAELVGELAAEWELGESPAERTLRRGAERLLRRFLAEEAGRGGPFEPNLFEAKFGEAEDSDRPSLEIDGWRLHGAIDRIDRGPGETALIHDYKVAGRVTPALRFEEDAKLQLPLYALAARELWGLRPVGALYHPLRATRERAPRGLVREEERPELDSYGLVKTDVLGSDQFDGILEEARERAGRIVARMRRGEITRDPGPPPGYRDHDVCPAYCSLA
ncbi:MAG TPA: PD-(D/E)XK nuclease family protein, partial [Solirubrobacterales bacterium]|nr:PD-(D/E)XK nuclease family protein [Solirubrobacterales bacterium]